MLKTNVQSKKLEALTLNNAITTEKKLMNAVANINGLEKKAGLLNTKVWTMVHELGTKNIRLPGEDILD